MAAGHEDVFFLRYDAEHRIIHIFRACHKDPAAPIGGAWVVICFRPHPYPGAMFRKHHPQPTTPTRHGRWRCCGTFGVGVYRLCRSTAEDALDTLFSALIKFNQLTMIAPEPLGGESGNMKRRLAGGRVVATATARTHTHSVHSDRKAYKHIRL